MKPKRSRVWSMECTGKCSVATGGPGWLSERVSSLSDTISTALKSGSPELAARLPELRDAIGFRNIPAHDHETVEPGIVWRIACDSLPELKRKAVSLFSELEAAPGARRTVQGIRIELSGQP